jgi:hypothetical protein
MDSDKMADLLLKANANFYLLSFMDSDKMADLLLKANANFYVFTIK